MSLGFFLRVGDKTTCGGQIMTGDPTFSWYGVPAARMGDKVTCGKHPGAYDIHGGVYDMWDEGQPLAGSLDSVSGCPCRATFIPTIVDSYVKDSGRSSQATASSVSPVLPVVAILPFPVFAKSCTLAKSCSDAGTAKEPHTNFVDMTILQAVPAPDPAEDAVTNEEVPQHAQAAKKKPVAQETIPPEPKKRSGLYKWLFGNHEEMEHQAATAAAESAQRAQTATDGANILVPVLGRAVTSGTWAVSIGELGRIAAAGPGGCIAGFLVGMLPGKLNDGEQEFIDRMRAEQMREAPTRVRFTWENDEKGNPVPHGWHTPPGKDMVRVRKMAWDDAQQAYTFTTEEEDPVTILWTPDHSGVNVPSNTGNQSPPKLPNPIMVNPLPEKVGSDIEVYPAPEEKSFRDYILILPIPDIPPIYIYLSKNPNDPIWTPRKKITEVQNAYNHWKKHGKEFPDIKNSKEYVDAVHDFVNNPPEGTLTKKRDNGDELFYHPETNTFATKAKSGAPRTMFKPKDKMDYWNDQ